MARRREEEPQPQRLKRSSDVDGRVRSTQSGSRSNGNSRPTGSSANRSNSKNGNRRRKKKKSGKKKVIVVIILVLLAVVLAAGAFLWSKLGKMNRIDLGKVNTNDINSDSKEVMSGYTTIALFGLDNRSNGSFESGNSDTIIVASINNATKEIRLVSVFRDSYLDVGDDTFTKCNAAYAKGGPKQAVNMLNTNLDLHITDYVAVDWNALVKTIDLLGGVDIELTEEEATYTIGYIDEIAGQTGVSTTYPSAGLQTLDGVQATAYARIRKTDGFDFKRTERQRTVINQIFEKAKQAKLTTLNTIIDEVFPDISTSLTNTEILSLASGIASYGMGENSGFPFEKYSAGENLNYIVIPVHLDQNVAELHKFLYDEENYTVSTQVQSISDKILNEFGELQAE